VGNQVACRGQTGRDLPIADVENWKKRGGRLENAGTAFESDVRGIR